MKNMMTSLALAATLAVVCGCATAPAPDVSAGDVAAITSATKCPPLKVGVYADHGASGIGAIEWFRLVNESPEMEIRLLDGRAVRAGGLNGLDMLVMPGGSSKAEFESLGTNGVNKLKSFIRNGGGYIGTCAGCCLLMDETGGSRKRANVMPWNTTGSESATMFPTFNLNAAGAAVLGLKEGPHVMRYHGGPFMWPTTNHIEGAKFELWGTYDAEATMKGRVDPKKRMYGAAAIIGGTYGKGRVFAISAHPEYFNSTLYVVKAAFKYVTGRDVTFPERRRSPRALSVGFLAKGVGGIDSAETALALAAEKDFDLVLIGTDGAAQRHLDHVDVLVLSNASPLKNKVLADAIDAFVARGGKIVAFGTGVKAMPKGGVKCGPRGDTVKAIRSLFD